VLALKVGVRILAVTAVLFGTLTLVTPAGAASFKPCSLLSVQQVSGFLGGRITNHHGGSTLCVYSTSSIPGRLTRQTATLLLSLTSSPYRSGLALPRVAGSPEHRVRFGRTSGYLIGPAPIGAFIGQAGVTPTLMSSQPPMQGVVCVATKNGHVVKLALLGTFVRVRTCSTAMVDALRRLVTPAATASFQPCSLLTVPQVSALLGGKGKVTAQTYELPAPIQGCLYRRGTQGPPDSGHGTGNSVFESVQTGSVAQAQFMRTLADAESKVGKPTTPITWAAMRRYIIHLDWTLVVHGGRQSMGPNDSAVTFWASKGGEYVTLLVEGSGDTVSIGKRLFTELLRHLPSSAAVSPPYKTPGPPPSPASCTSTPSLAPTTATPAYPTIPGVLSYQYPSVYGGYSEPKTQPGVTKLVIFETAHDPTLETEVRSHTLQSIDVSFIIAPRSLVCLNAIETQVGKTLGVRQAGITWTSLGVDEQTNQVSVSVSACTPSGISAADAWYQQRWGDAVSVTTCQPAASW
jgi:hypothetical protein